DSTQASRGDQDVTHRNPRHQRARLTRISVLFLAVSLSVGCTGGVDDPVSLLNRARALCDRQRADEALTVLAKVQSLEPGNRDACYLQGIAHEQNGAFEKAIDAYDRCLLKDPQHTDSLNNRGVLHGRMGDFERALEDLKTAITINPSDALAWSNLGLAYHELGQFESAIATYKKAIELTPNAQVLFQRGNAHYADRSYGSAIRDYSQAIKLENGFAKAYLNRALAHLRSGDREAGYRDLALAEQYDDDMTVATVVDSVRLMFRAKQLHERAVKATRDWLESTGWQTQDHPEFHFTATGLTAPESSPVSERYDAVVMISNERDEIISDIEIVKAALSSQERLCLFVIDSSQLDGSSVDESTKQPFWLRQAVYDWRPTKNQFQAHTVRLILPEQSDAESEAPLANE
ncbi:MAG: tetratricopeptide repeat protein, partial [Planctomycetota bacterium]